MTLSDPVVCMKEFPRASIPNSRGDPILFASFSGSLAGAIDYLEKSSGSRKHENDRTAFARSNGLTVRAALRAPGTLNMAFSSMYR